MRSRVTRSHLRTLSLLAGIAAAGLAVFGFQAGRPNPTPQRVAAPIKTTAPVSLQADLPLPPPEISTALRDWSQRYQAAAETEKPSMLDQGIALARERRTALAQLIRKDPERALAEAIPRSQRASMPPAVLAELEELISARAPLELIYQCLHPEGAKHDHRDDLYRSTVIGGREFRVYVYGSRARDASLPATSLHGIAIDGHLAVSDSRVRVLESGEPLPPASGPTAAGSVAVEADGTIHILSSADQVPAFEAALVAAEDNPLDLGDSGAGSSTVTGRPAQVWTHGDKKLLVIRVDFSDLPGTPVNSFDGNAQITDEYVSNVINGTSGVRNFFKESSFSKTDILLTPPSGGDSPDVTQVFRMPSTASSYATTGNNSLLHADARAAASAANYNLDDYDRICVVFSHLGNLPGSNIDYGGLANVTGKNLWINGAFDFRVVSHELGHNHGLHHANLWQVADGNPASLSGSSTEYGDPFDTMGSTGSFSQHFSHWNKSILQWIPDQSVTLASSSGTFRIHRFDAAAANLNLPRALKIVRDQTRDYWIGYRRATNSSAADNGAYVLWGYNSNQQGNLLDLNTPGSSASDAPLAIGSSFNDSAAGITIQTVAQGGSGADEWLDVSVTLQARLQWGAASYLVNEQGGSAVLSVTRSNNSSGAVSVQYATASGTASSGSDFTSTSGTLHWTDGDSTPKTISIPLAADALVEGNETFSVTLSSATGGVIVSPATTTVTIADPGSRDSSFNADFVNSAVNRSLVLPDGNILIAGWFSQLQDAAFDLYNYGRIARLLPNGSIDTGFNPGSGANAVVYALARQADGKVLIGGDFSSFNGVARGRIARLHPDGSLDTSFAIGSGANGTVYAILPQPDGRILVGGAFTSYDGSAAEYLVRLNADGSRDTGFTGPNFGGDTGWRVNCLALQADGKCLVGGSFYFSGSPFKAGLCRVLSSGALDTGFNGIAEGAHLAGNTGSLRDIEHLAIQPDGKILIVGNFTAYNNTARGGFARLTSTGALDATFSPQPNSDCYALLLLPDQSALIGGDFTSVSGTNATRIARILPNGNVDANFAAAGGHAGRVEDLTLQPDGNVVLVGDYDFFQNAPYDGPVWRLVPGLAGRPGVIQFATDASITGIEGSTASVQVSRSGGSLGALTIAYSTVAGTASGSTDFTPTAGTLTWANGNTDTQTISIPISADAIADTPETLQLNLGEALIGGAILGARQQASVTIGTAFENWSASHFSAAELNDPAISGDAADPDGDGLSNLAEFALCLNPRSSDRGQAWTLSVQNLAGSDYLTLSFRRRTPALDLNYVVEADDQLDAPVWESTGILVGTPTAHGDGTETVTFRDTVPVDSAVRRFMRVNVTRTP